MEAFLDTGDQSVPIPPSFIRDSDSMLGMATRDISLARPLEKPQMQKGLVPTEKSWEVPMRSMPSLVNPILLGTIHSYLFKQRILPETEDEEEAAVSGPEGSEEVLQREGHEDTREPGWGRDAQWSPPWGGAFWRW